MTPKQQPRCLAHRPGLHRSLEREHAFGSPRAALSDGFNLPSSIAVDTRTGEVSVADTRSHRIQGIDDALSDSSVGVRIDISGTAPD